MANQVDESKRLDKTREMHGRRVIKSSVSKITEDNVVEVLLKALNTHNFNSSEISYLWDYYRGKQPILARSKETRPEINNKIVENRANEIVAFKVGYLCGEPIQYVGRNGEERTTSAIQELNELMFAEDKASKDQQVVEWQMICGTAYRLVLPDKDGEEDEAPFEIYTLDPRETFVVYSNQIGNKPLMAVKYCKDTDTQVTTYSIYTENQYFLIEDTFVKATTNHALGMIPIIEYPANNARMGAFEVVLPLLDTMNLIASNRMDGIEQVVQAFIKFINCDISKEEYEEFLKLGAIKVKSVDGQSADVDSVVTELNQTQTQTFKDDCYNAILTICGVPNRNGGTSTSDTGAAVLLRDGWSLAEARAKDSEHMFKLSEKQMLKLVLRICRDLTDLDLHLRDIEMKFTRRNYENIQSKAQVLTTMLDQEKIHPLLAFEHSGMFTDPESAYTLSMKYYEEQQNEREDVIDNNPIPFDEETDEQGI